MIFVESGHTVSGSAPPLIAADLAGAPVRGITQLGGGRNSRVFRVETAAATYALKLYPSRVEDSQDRLGVETTALRWMEAHGLTMVPRVIAADRERAACLLSWAEGNLAHDGVVDADIAQAWVFLRRLHDLRGTPAVPQDHLAAEACLSAAEIERQIRLRIDSLRCLKEPALTRFLDGHVEPALAARLDRARIAIAAAGGEFAIDLPASRRSQVPSDFGFHNALRRADGQLTFIDFEYFGWDDPAKLVADVLLHPGTPLDHAARTGFLAGALEVYGNQPGFAERLDALLPLLGLRWCLILLNEFRPERWQRRVIAGASETWTSAKQRQLAAARGMLERHVMSRRVE